MTATKDNRELGKPLEALMLDENALADYLVEHIPGFGRDCSIQQFLGGQSNPTYLIESGNKAYVLRKKPPGNLLPSAHAVDREYRVISALADSGVPVPNAHLLCEDVSVIGQMFYVMDYVPGRVPAERGMPGYTETDRRDMYRAMARVLGTLHSIDYQSAGLESFGKPNAYVSRQVHRWSNQYTASKVEECPPMDELIAWLPENDPDDGYTSIVHGDYRPGNIIFRNDSPDLAAVLDWELSTIGHPLADLGYFFMPHRVDAATTPYGLQGMDLEQLGIPAEAELMETYVSSAGRNEVPNIDYYIVFSMFRLAAILAGVMRRGLDGNAADPRAIERGKSYQQIASTAMEIANSSR
jgi:aminoglycoside phosphotransferase (APT) family kinase protein